MGTMVFLGDDGEGREEERSRKEKEDYTSVLKSC